MCTAFREIQKSKVKYFTFDLYLAPDDKKPTLEALKNYFFKLIKKNNFGGRALVDGVVPTGIICDSSFSG